MALLKCIEKVCVVCSSTFFVDKANERIHKPKYCSVKCFASTRKGKSSHKLTLEQLFFSNIQKTDGCWLWSGCTNSKDPKFNYGILRFNRKKLYSHRLSWVIHNGKEIPKGMEVCHECDTPLCCNPKHLFLGTHKENMQDMSKKGRTGITNGVDSPSNKLTESQVLEIRHIHSKGLAGYRKLSQQFGVDRTTIRSIILRLKWRHI